MIRFLISLFCSLFYLASAALGASIEKSAINEERIKNEQVRAILRNSGDDTLAPRSVRHFAYFPTAKGQNEFKALVQSRGYTIIDAYTDNTNALLFVVLFSKWQAPGDIDEETAILRATAAQVGGEYDGWETTIVLKK